MTERADEATIQLKVRMKESTRAAFEALAKAHEWTLNREINDQLERALRNNNQFGGPRTADVFRAAAAEISFVEQATGEHWLDDFGTFHVVKRLLDDLITDRTPTPPSDKAIAEAYRELKAAEADEAKALREMFDRAPKNPLSRRNALLALTGPYERPDPEAPEHAGTEHGKALGAFYSSEEGQRLMEASELARRRRSEAAKAFEESWREADEAKSNALKLASEIIEFKKIRQERSEGGGA